MNKKKLLTIFFVIVGCVVMLSSTTSAINNAKDLIGANDKETQESVADDTACVDIEYEIAA